MSCCVGPGVPKVPAPDWPGCLIPGTAGFAGKQLASTLRVVVRLVCYAPRKQRSVGSTSRFRPSTIHHAQMRVSCSELRTVLARSPHGGLDRTSIIHYPLHDRSNTHLQLRKEHVGKLILILCESLIDQGIRFSRGSTGLAMGHLCPRWGTAQLLANLGDAAWVQAANSDAAVAAVHLVWSCDLWPAC